VAELLVERHPSGAAERAGDTVGITDDHRRLVGAVHGLSAHQGSPSKGHRHSTLSQTLQATRRTTGPLSVPNDGRLTEHIETVRAEAAERLQDLRESVDTLHAGTNQELREGLREVREQIEALRADLGRDIAQQRDNLTEYRNTTRQLRRQVEQLRDKDRSPATAGGIAPEHAGPEQAEEPTEQRLEEGAAEPGRLSTASADGTSSENFTQQEATVSQPPALPDDTAPQDPSSDPDATAPPVSDARTPETAETLRKQEARFFSILSQAAALSTVELECHGDTWAFLQQTAHSTRFPLPIPLAGDDGMVKALISGPVLIGVLNALHAVHWDWKSAEPPWDRSSIETRALALSLYAGLTEAITGDTGDQRPGERFRIIVDRRYHSPITPTDDEPGDAPTATENPT